MADTRQDLPWFRDKLLLSAVGLILAVALLGAGLLAYVHAQTMREGMRLTAAFAAVIDEQTSRTLQTVDLQMELLSDTLADIKQADGEGEAARLRNQGAIRATMDALPFLESLVLIDADGKVVQASDPALQGADLSARDYVTIYKTRPGTGFFIGAPVVGPSGEWLLPMARRMTVDRQGTASVLVANIRAQHFDLLWAALALESDSTLGLLRSDGQMLLRSPIDGAAMGRSFSGSPLFRQYLPTSPQGGYRIISTVDGKDRHIAYRTLGQQPDLVVTVGRTIDSILAPWYRLALLLVGLWLGASLSLLYLSVRLVRQSGRRKQAESANAALVKRLRIASESAGLVLWEWDIASGSMEVTPTYYTTLGLPPQVGPVTLAQWQSRVHPDDQTIARQAVQLRAHGNDKYDHQFRMQHADGNYRWMRTTGQVHTRDSHGRPTRMIGIRIDVTDRVLAEQERQQVFDRISDAFVALDNNWCYTFVNARAAEIFGRKPQDLVGKHIWTEFPEDRGQRFQRLYEEALATQTPISAEEYYPPYGRWFENHIYPSAGGLTIYFHDITERKLGEQALRAAKEQAENLINGANVMVVGLDAQGQITIFNKMAQELTGYTLVDLAGRNWFEILVPRERYPQVHAEFERLSTGGLPQHFENPILTSTGEERVIAWQNSVLRDGDTVTGILSFGMDVTLRHKAELQLAESKEQFETLANSSLQGIALIRKGYFKYLNPAFCAITGRSASELLRTSVSQAMQWVHPEDRAASMERYRRAATGDAVPHTNQLRLLTSQGQWRWIQVATRSITLGGAPAVLDMLLDVHDRYIADEALRNSEERFRSAFDSSGIGMGLTRMDGHWLQVNPSLCRIVGYTAEEMSRLTFMEMTHPDDLASDLSAMDDLRAGCATHFSMEKRYLHRNGQPVWVNLTVALVRNADGEPLYTVAQMENIDRRKKLEGELRESQASLKATIDALPDLMFDVDLQGTLYAGHSPRADLLLRSVPELTGKRLADLMPADAHAIAMTALHEADLHGHSTGHQMRLELPQGIEWFELSITRKETPPQKGPRFIVLSRHITDRIRALDALRASEELMRQMAESVSQMFFLTDLQESRFLYVSPAVERVLGYSLQALYADQRIWHRHVHAQDWPMVQDALRLANSSGTMDMQFRITTTQDSLRWVHVRAFPVLDAQGKPYRSAGAAEDITLRKSLEIREEQELAMLQYMASNRPLPEILEKFVLTYETLVPGMKGSVLLMDPDGIHLRHGAAPHLPAAYCAAVDGLAIGPNAGSCATAAFTGESTEVVDMQTDPSWTNYRDLATQYDLRACWSVPIKGMQGHVLGAFAFYFDHMRTLQASEQMSVMHGAHLAGRAIERHQAVQALQRSEARYRGVVEWSPMGITIIQAGLIVYCNPAVLEIHRATSMQDIVGFPVTDRIHPDDRALVMRLGRQVLEHNESTEQIEIRSLRMDGSLVDLQASGAPTSFDGAPAVQVIMLDVSARKEAEAALLASRQQLRLLSTRVLAAQETERRRVAHELHDELGQSLTAIKINLQSHGLVNGGEPGDSNAENIRIVDQALQHVRQLALALRPSMLDDLGLVSALRWLTDQVRQRHKLDVQLRVSDGVGRLPPDTETAVFRIVQEALTNIERHASADTVRISTDIEADDTFVVRIADNGCGFDVRAMFAQASAGASMGILGMDERATLIGASLRITSTPGGGTTVTLLCPLITDTID